MFFISCFYIIGYLYNIIMKLSRSIIDKKFNIIDWFCYIDLSRNGNFVVNIAFNFTREKLVSD